MFKVGDKVHTIYASPDCRLTGTIVATEFRAEWMFTVEWDNGGRPWSVKYTYEGRELIPALNGIERAIKRMS